MRQALAVRRQHPDHEALWCRALGGCRRALLAATADRPLVIELRDGHVHANGEALFAFGPAELPFGPMRQAGIGAIELGQGLGSASIEQLVARLLTVSEHPDPEQGVAGLFVEPELAGVQLHAALGSSTADRPALDWLPILPTAPPPAELRKLVARDLAANWPALTARQLREDLAGEPASCAEGLLGLLSRMLADDDWATAGWLLGEISQDEAVPPPLRARLLAVATAHCSDAWLASRIAQHSANELLALAAFVFELGAAAVERFVALTAEANQPLARLLADVLGKHTGTDRS